MRERKKERERGRKGKKVREKTKERKRGGRMPIEERNMQAEAMHA